MSTNGCDSHKVIVLVVEDSDDHAELITRWVKDTPLFPGSCTDVVRASSKDQAVIMLRQDPRIRCVIWDCHLPNGDISDLVVVRATFRKMPIIGVSTNAAEKGVLPKRKEDVQHALQACVTTEELPT